MSPALPFVEELSPPPDPEAAFVRLASQRHCVFLDSAMHDPALGRYSFLAADPFDYFEFCGGGGGNEAPLDLFGNRLARFPALPLAGLPPFQGGAAGLLSYDLGRCLERVPAPAYDEFQAPWLAVGFYDALVAWDHMEQRAWIISQGFPELGPTARARRAKQRLDQLRSWLAAPGPSPIPPDAGIKPLLPEELAPQFPVPLHDALTSNFSRPRYLAAVRRAIEYVYAGDVFQVNLAQRLLHPARCDSVTLYRRLRRLNPAPFAGYFDLGAFQIVSASPERFASVRDRLVETRPIKGTRPRSPSPETDRLAGEELRGSEKDRAENVMIVDLLRNDLSRVCEPDSVRVRELCTLETYRFVQHLVSVVQGRLRLGLGPVDLVRAAFPGGSVTGAPKVRAMEIIAELEPTARGPYCGCLGYVGFDGTVDLNILIRTITAGRGWWQLPVGGGIVAQSVPEQEYQETWDKATGLIQAML